MVRVCVCVTFCWTVISIWVVLLEVCFGWHDVWNLSSTLITVYCCERSFLHPPKRHYFSKRLVPGRQGPLCIDVKWSRSACQDGKGLRVLFDSNWVESRRRAAILSIERMEPFSKSCTGGLSEEETCMYTSKQYQWPLTQQQNYRIIGHWLMCNENRAEQELWKCSCADRKRDIMQITDSYAVAGRLCRSKAANKQIQTCPKRSPPACKVD